MSLLILVRSLVSRIGNHVNHFICSAFVSFVVHQLSPSDTVMAESSDDDQEVSKELEVVIGTYEHFLIGYKVKVNGEKYKFEPSFTNRAHTGYVRSVASSNHELIASGGTDEVVRLFNIVKRSDVGTLMQQEGSITCIEFWEDSHVFTGSEDGTICIFDTNNWECLKTLRGHKGAVNWLSVHPSGKMCLSVSRDKTLRTWNLIKGRCAYITNLKVVADLVHWSPTGQEFVTVVGTKLDLYNISTGSVVHSHDFGRRITCINFISENTIAIGGEAGLIRFFSISKEKVVQEFTAHDNRIKELRWIKGSDVPSGSGSKNNFLGYLFTISSDSHLKLWLLSRLEEKPSLLAEMDIKCRPTCMTVFVPTITLSDPELVATGENVPVGQKENRKRKQKTETTKQMKPSGGEAKRTKT